MTVLKMLDKRQYSFDNACDIEFSKTLELVHFHVSSCCTCLQRRHLVTRKDRFYLSMCARVTVSTSAGCGGRYFNLFNFLLIQGEHTSNDFSVITFIHLGWPAYRLSETRCWLKSGKKTH